MKCFVICKPDRTLNSVGRGCLTFMASSHRRWAAMTFACVTALGACGTSASHRPAVTRANTPAPHPAGPTGASASPTGASAGPTGASAGPLRAAGWAQAIHDPQHASAVPLSERGPRSDHLRWKRRFGEGPVTPGPIVGPDGTVYAATNGGKLHAINPATGEDLWSFSGGAPYGGDLSTSPALLAGGTILWPGPRHTLYAVMASSGRLLWEEPFRADVLSPVVAPSGRAYVQDRTGLLKAIDVHGTTHAVAWDVSPGEGSSSSPALAPDGTIVVGTDQHLTAIADQGAKATTVWSWPSPAQIEVSPAVAPDGTVIVGLNDPFVYGVRAGKLAWTFRKDDWSYSSAAATPDGKVYLGDHTGRLDVLNASTGEAVIRIATNPPKTAHHETGGSVGIGVWTSPAVDGGGNVYFGTAAGHIYGAAPDGTILFDIDTGGVVDSYPALGPDGTLYIGSSSGTLYAVG
jgi:outer membrane protein assembly factor BamB